MTTSRLTHSRRAVLGAASVLVVSFLPAFAANSVPAAPDAPAISLRTTCTDTSASSSAARPHVVSATLERNAHGSSYDWPVKPFDRQHPVRAFMDDPRIGKNGVHAFHFGIDIAVPDGTLVYSVAAGTVYFDSSEALAVLSPDHTSSFGYWHVIPMVKSHQHVARHTVLGRVAPGWGHVHFAERIGKVYVNPLRPGGLGPYADRTAPTVDEIGIDGSSLVVAAHDTPDLRVPGAWADEPVTPALLRWRVLGANIAAPAWHTAADFRAKMLDRARFAHVYTDRTRQNHEGRPGQFCFRLAAGWNETAPAVVQVEVTDTAGNRAVFARRVVARAGA